MPSMDAALRDLNPQPIARIPLKAFLAWKDALIKQLQVVEAERSAHHPLGQRLKNMAAFVDRECTACTRVNGATAHIQAGKFSWCLVRLEQRQEGMKRLIAADDPFVHQIDPVLRRRIKKGWNLLGNVNPKFWSHLKSLQRQSRTTTKLGHDTDQLGRGIARSVQRLRRTSGSR